MAATNDTCIGRLTEVQESRMMAMLTHDQGFPRIDIEGRQVAVGQIGSYLIVRQGSIQVVTMVISIVFCACTAGAPAITAPAAIAPAPAFLINSLLFTVFLLDGWLKDH